MVGNYFAAPNNGPENYGWWLNGYISTEPAQFDPTIGSVLGDDCLVMSGISRVYNNIAATDVTGPVVYTARF